MKPVTTNFKNQIKKFGREIKVQVIIGQTTLTNNTINRVSLSYDGAILKSVMKKLEIDCNIPILKNTILDFKFGVKVGNSYEYIDYGNFKVVEVEKQEDTNSYLLTCYDKMIEFMKDYEFVGISFPTTLGTYLYNLCNAVGVTTTSTPDFANANQILTYDPFLDANNNSLGYTYRDILDNIAEASGGIICINDDELEVRYMNNTQEEITGSFLKDINVKFGEIYGPVNSIVLSRSAGADNVYLRDEQSITTNGLCEIKIEDNQIMNGNDRDTYLPALLNVLDGLTFAINDYKSTGICYLELCDKYNVTIDNATYNCILFNDEIIIEGGLEENIYTEIPEQSETDYEKADKTDRRINQAYAMVDKQNLTITNLVSETRQNQQLNDARILELQERTNSVIQTITSQQATIEVIQRDVIASQETLQNSLVTININGINVSTSTSAIATLMSYDKFEIRRSGYSNPLAFIGYDEETGQTKSEMDNLVITNYFTAGYHRVEKFNINAEHRTGWFYND